MADRQEEAKPSVWQSAALDGGRRFDLQLDDTKLKLVRKGPTFWLKDGDGRNLAKASIRRSEGHVVIRDGEGFIIGHTQKDEAGLSIIPPEARPEVAGKGSEALATVVISDKSIELRIPGQKSSKLRHTEECWRASSGLCYSDDGEWLQGAKSEAKVEAIEARSDLTPAALWLLANDQLSPPHALAFAVHLSFLE